MSAKFVLYRLENPQGAMYFIVSSEAWKVEYKPDRNGTREVLAESDDMNALRILKKLAEGESK